MNRQKLIMLAGYNTFFWVCFWLFAYWTFPYDRVAVYLTDQVAHSGSGYNVEIKELSPYWVTGVEVEDVKIKKLGTDASAVSEPGKDDGFHVKEARVRLGMFALLFGNRSVNFDAELDQGELEGSYEESGDGKHLDATLSGVDLAKLGLMESLISVPATGTVGGDFDLTLDKEPTKSTGTAKLRISNLTLGDGKAKLKLAGMMGGLTIDPIEAGNVTMELDVKEGVGTVKKLSNDGKDVELEGSGEIHLAEPLTNSRIDLLLRLKINDAYKNKTARTKAMMSLLDGMTVSQVTQAKTPDGSLQYRLAGSIAAMRAIPAGRSRPGGGAARGPSPAMGGSKRRLGGAQTDDAEE